LERSFLTVLPETVAISAWLQKPDGHHLRLYESVGQEGDVEVKLPFAAHGCQSVDLNGRAWESPRIDLAHDTVRFRIRPWEIVTLRFSASGSRG
jgi:alpha-mannosidase